MIEPGIYTMPAAEYHSLATPTPALSSSIARILLGASPLHARYRHPALSPDSEPEEREAFDIGSAAHALLLEGTENVSIIDAADWRTRDARLLREAARAAGKTPILKHRWLDVQQLCESVRTQLAAHPAPRPLANGAAEQTLIWREDDLWAKARLDWLHTNYAAIDDLKTSDDANPDTWSRGPLFSHGFDLQAAWYLRGLRVLTGEMADFRFVVAETKPPYAVSVIGLGPDVQVLAEKKVRRALDLWRQCLTTNRWPGYPTRTVYADLPIWEESRWLNREMRDAADTPSPVEIS